MLTTYQESLLFGFVFICCGLFCLWSWDIKTGIVIISFGLLFISFISVLVSLKKAEKAMRDLVEFVKEMRNGKD